MTDEPARRAHPRASGPRGQAGAGRRAKPAGMTREQALALIDNFLRNHGVDPAEATDERGWRRVRLGTAEGAAGVVEWASGEPYLVVVAPLLELDPEAEGIDRFYRLLLELNHDGTDAARFSLQDDVLSITLSRPIRGLSAGEVEYAIDTVMHAADHYGERLEDALAVLLGAAPLPLAELPRIKMTPAEAEKMSIILADCDTHGLEIFRYLVERWDKAGHEVSVGKGAVSLDARAGGNRWALAGLRPVDDERLQIIILGWDGLRRFQAFPAQAVDRFQARVMRIAEPHIRETTAHIWVDEGLEKKQAKALLAALDKLAQAIGPEPPEPDVEAAWDERLPHIEIQVGPVTREGIEDTLLACEPRVQGLYALLIEGWSQAGGTVQCSQPGRIYLKLKTWEQGLPAHQLSLAVLAAANGKRGPAIDVAWNLARGDYAHLDHLPDVVARFEAVVAGLPGFERTGAVTRLLVGEGFTGEHAAALLEAMLELKGAASGGDAGRGVPARGAHGGEMTGDRAVPEIGPRQLDAILRFLPIFEQPGYAFGEWHSPEGGLPSYSMSPEATRFLEALYKQAVVFPFDWPGWREEAERLVDDPQALAEADLVVLRKLLTAHVRADRFSEGHLASVLESGHITAILRRLKEIREGMR